MKDKMGRSFSMHGALRIPNVFGKSQRKRVLGRPGEGLRILKFKYVQL
jgi:hypothetical protein